MSKKVILFPTYEQALRHRKQYASSESRGSFGVSYQTPTAWLEEAWDRFGTSQKLVSKLDRAFVARKVLSCTNGADNYLEVSKGNLSLLCQFFSEAIGTDALEAALVPESSVQATLSSQERFVLSLIEPYRAVLKEQGLIEQGDALNYLKSQDLPYVFEVHQSLSLNPVLREFFHAMNACFVDQPAAITPLPEGVSFQQLLSAGPSSHHALITKSLCSTLDRAQSEQRGYCALVVTSSAKELYFNLQKLFPARGIACELHTRIPFEETDFGRAYQSLKTFLLDNDHDVQALLDYAQSSFSGMDFIRFSQISSAIRADRLLSFEEAVAIIRVMSPHFDMFEELMYDSDASLVLDYFEDATFELADRDETYRFVQRSAIAALRNVYEAARRWKVAPSDIDFILEQISIGLSCTTDARALASSSGEQRVILAIPNCSDVEPYVCDEVMVCDLDSRCYAAGDRHDSLTTLETKIGIDVPQYQLQKDRQWFENLKMRAKSHFCIERTLSSGGDEELYPSFLWDEFMAYYSSTDEFGMELVPSPQLDVITQGEESFAANTSVDAADPCSLALPLPDSLLSDHVENTLFPYLFLTQPGAYSGRLVLSPSAIEAYINCPYYWFVAQRVRPQAPDEQFGSLEQGSFVHGVFDAFYTQLVNTAGSNRVTPENLKQSQSLLAEVFDEELKKQPSLESTRYLPLSPSEQAQTEKLKQTLLDNLSLQASMMPSFVPTYHEFEIRREHTITYAGVTIRGRIDRIDVCSDLNQFVVLDYKGSISGHEAGYDPDTCDQPDTGSAGSSVSMVLPELPHKIQALIYAQVLRSLIPQRPVGALYLNYRAQNSPDLLAGSYDKAMLSVDRFTKRSSAVTCNFESYLDLVEEHIAKRLADLQAGNIEKKPLSQKSCVYCSVDGCSRRLS